MAFDFLQERARNTSNNARNKDRKNLLAMWNWGIPILGIRNNPIKPQKPKLPHTKKDIYVPTEREVVRLLAVAQGEDRNMLRLFIMSGGRRDEIFRLKWEDVNFEKRLIRLKTKKNRDGNIKHRDIPMSPRTYEGLMWQWENRLPHSDFVFQNKIPHSKYYGGRWVARQKMMKGLCERAEIPHFGFHTLRRFFTSIHLDKHKASLKAVQDLLGHSGPPNMTWIYNFNIAEDTRALVGRMDEMFEEQWKEVGDV